MFGNGFIFVCIQVLVFFFAATLTAFTISFKFYVNWMREKKAEDAEEWNSASELNCTNT